MGEGTGVRGQNTAPVRKSSSLINTNAICLQQREAIALLLAHCIVTHFAHKRRMKTVAIAQTTTKSDRLPDILNSIKLNVVICISLSTNSRNVESSYTRSDYS